VSKSVVLNGTPYSIPTTGDRDWSRSLTAYLEALATANADALGLISGVAQTADDAYSLAQEAALKPSIIHFGAASTPANDNDPYYLYPGFSESAASPADGGGGTRLLFPVPAAGTLSHMFVQTFPITPTTDAITFTLESNGSDVMVCTLPAGAAGASNQIDSVPIPLAGTFIAVRVNAPELQPALNHPIVTLRFTPS